ncbi:transcription termination factor Rho [Akkermansia sp. N21116]|uniref:transcription termination factor Rho n=1 Tax=Akkermansia sp. N21116 TaxID=3040764 RepID=UPI00244E8C02|nr:transcription termination factor Rho [Akkermansia sp. N21116]WPX41052.1 transcription termination factor Rho [Akkermansia sp. N21116]
MNEEQQELNLDQEDPVQDAVPGGAVETIVPTDGASPEYADSVQPSQIAEAVSSVESLPILSVNELRLHSMTELQQMAENTSLRNIGGLTKSQLVFELGRLYLREGRDLVVEGVMEQAKDNYAMLRDPVKSFRTSPDDIYVSGELIRRHGLKVGNMVKVRLRRLRPHDKYLSACEVLEVEGIPAEEYRAVKDFDKLTPLFPRERIILENKEIDSPAMRVLDLVTPFGKGQRGLIVAPPRGGKTILLKTIARSIHANYRDIELIVLLLDERPEEVTDFEETVGVSVFASTFDEPSRRHAQVSDLVIERAKRLVEQGKDVVILLDSLTRLSRGYNANQSGGRIMSGGLGSNALEKPRKFFGAARNVEEGGSLTILATCLVDTESRMDEVIFEEFKGTGNMEIRLDRELSERRIYPAISLSQSGTRNDDRLYNEQEFQKILQVRRQLAVLPGWEGLELLLKNIARTQNNAELEIMGLR